MPLFLIYSTIHNALRHKNNKLLKNFYEHICYQHNQK